MKDIKQIYEERKKDKDFCPIEDISTRFIFFVLLFEDGCFYGHKGINYKGNLLNLIKTNIDRKAKDLTPVGLSTITQQLIKNLYFSFEPRILRKIYECFLAVDAEKKLTKNEILELYLNVIYFDNGIYGIRDASIFYFNKEPKDLTLNQSCFLAIMLPVVGLYNPLFNPDKFMNYRNRKLEKALKNGDINEKMYKEIIKHNEKCLDEELRKPSDEYLIYNKPGPMINERFGPNKKIQN